MCRIDFVIDCVFRLHIDRSSSESEWMPFKRKRLENHFRQPVSVNVRAHKAHTLTWNERTHSFGCTHTVWHFIATLLTFACTPFFQFPLFCDPLWHDFKCTTSIYSLDMQMLYMCVYVYIYRALCSPTKLYTFLGCVVLWFAVAVAGCRHHATLFLLPNLHIIDINRILFFIYAHRLMP